MKRTLLLALMVFIVGVLTTTTVLCQDPERKLSYIDLNSFSNSRIHDIRDFTLNIQYNDVYGASADLKFSIFDAGRRVVARVVTDKSFGVNNYSLKLDELFNGWEMDAVYLLEFRNENNTLFQLPFRIAKPLENPDPLASIMINPLAIGCKDLKQSTVEFYGVINGGSAPYAIHWYVLNAAKSDFLFQPREEMLQVEGKTSLITVDQNPEYTVALYVKDACGKEAKQLVTISCADSKKKINSLFLEELILPKTTGQ
jgi:hypothetical protein